MKILNKNRNAFTLVEMTISVAVALVAFLLIFQFLSSTRHHFLYGTVNLQNLKEGRLAINYLRRDFSCACPRLEDPDDVSYSDFQRTRKQIFATVSGVGGNAGDLIQVLPNGLLFYKFAFLPTSEKPTVEQVRYEFDSSAKTLIRSGEGGKTQKFTGIEDVEFKVYVHQLEEAVPLLWVRLKIHEGENLYGSEKIGSALELTTSISSPFLNSSTNNPYWRFETGHKKL